MMNVDLRDVSGLLWAEQPSVYTEGGHCKHVSSTAKVGARSGRFALRELIREESTPADLQNTCSCNINQRLQSVIRQLGLPEECG